MVLEILDWIVKVAERLVVLALVLLVFWFGYHLYCGDAAGYQVAVLKALGDNWKALLILLLVVFYDSVKTFLEEVQEFGGMKRERKGRPEGEEQAPTE